MRAELAPSGQRSTVGKVPQQRWGARVPFQAQSPGRHVGRSGNIGQELRNSGTGLHSPGG